MRTLFILLILAFTTINAQTKGPKIVPSENDFNFGDINEGEIVAHNFKIFNKGDEALTIIDVKASCGCTAVQPEKRELKPGESTSIKVEFNSIGRIGKQNKTVYVTSNDKQNPQLRLVFTANILEKKGNKEELFDRPILKLGSTQHNFGTVKQGEVVEFSFPFQNAGKKELVINDIQESCNCTVTQISSKKIQPGQYGSLKIQLDTKDREGKLSRTVTLMTNDTVNPKQSITLFVNIIKKD